MEKEVIIKEIIKIIRQRLPVDYRILLFGSWARGDATETSDIDIGIWGEKEAGWDTMVKIRQEIDDIPTLRKIDIVDLNLSEQSFRDNVLKYAKIL